MGCLGNSKTSEDQGVDEKERREANKTLELTQHNPWALKAEIITAFSKLFLTDKYPCHLDALPGSTPATWCNSSLI